MDNVEDDVEEAGGSVRYVYSIGERSGRSSDTARLEGAGTSDVVEAATVVAAVDAAAADRAKLVTLATDIDFVFVDADCCCCCCCCPSGVNTDDDDDDDDEDDIDDEANGNGGDGENAIV